MIVSRHNRAAYLIAAFAGVLAAVLVIRPIVFHPGLPAYHHDWSLPFSAAAFRAGFIGHLSSWDPSGVGTPNAFASANPVFAFISLLGFIFPPIVAGKFLVVLCIATAGVTTVYCMRTLEYCAAASGLAAVSYVCSPALFNKLAAGHVGFWVAYALFPLVVGNARGAALRDPRSMAVLVLAAGASVVQPQFAVLDVIAAAIVGMAFAGVRGLFSVAITAVAVTAMELPTMYSLRNAAETIVSQVPAPLASWEALQSTTLVDAVQLNHYIVPYFETAIGYYGWLSLLTAVLAVAGAVRAIKSRAAIVAIAFAIVGLAILTGTKGPFAALWSWGFLHVRAFSLMRELYNGSVLMAFALSLGIAMLANRQPRPVAAAIAVALACAFSLQLMGGVGRVLQNVAVPNYVLKAQNDIAALPPGRILPLPLITPMRNHDVGVGGIDTFAIAVADRMHPSATAYPTSFPLLQLAAAQSLDDPRWRALARNANLVAMDGRPDMTTVEPFSVKPHGVGVVTHPPYGITRLDGGALVSVATRAVTQGPAFPDSSTPDVVALSPEEGPLPDTGGRVGVVTPSANRFVDDPHAAWVDAQRWIELAPDWSVAVSGGVLTQSTATLTMQLNALDGPAILMSTSGEASVVCGSRARLVAQTPVRWIPLGRCTTLLVRNRKGVTAVYRAASGSATVPSGEFSPAVVDGVSRAFPWKVSTHIHASTHHHVIVVFSEQFSRGWELHGAHVLWHGMANGFANAWEIEPTEGAVTFFYAPQRIVNVLCVLSDALYIAVAFAFILHEIHGKTKEITRA